MRKTSTLAQSASVAARARQPRRGIINGGQCTSHMKSVSSYPAPGSRADLQQTPDAAMRQR
jgi:hypothetical protein